MNRNVPWAGLGVNVENVIDSVSALDKAGLNWEVKQCPVYTSEGIIPNYVANIREDTGEYLGIVSKSRYVIVQNRDAFLFIDELIREGLTLESAGILAEGRKVWLLAKLPETIILNDKVIPYICFTNSHDGKGSVRVLMTPIRFVCSNTLNLAIRTAPRIWSTIHTGNILTKISEAARTLELTNDYMNNFKNEIELLATQKISDFQAGTFIEELLPTEDAFSDRKIMNIDTLRSHLWYKYKEESDIQNIKGTAYGFISAVSDFVTHRQPQRKTDTFQANLFEKTINGHPLIDKAYDLLKAV